MGRLFWKFFVCILLAQLAATVGIGGAVWLKNRNQQAAQTDIDTSPPAEMAINSAAATLEFGGTNALKRMLENMDRRRVYAVNDAGHELLARVVSPAMLRESHALLRDEGRRRVVRQVYDPQGNRYLLFLPSAERQRGFESETRPLLAGLGDAQMALQGGPRMGGAPGEADVVGNQRELGQVLQPDRRARQQRMAVRHHDQMAPAVARERHQVGELAQAFGGGVDAHHPHGLQHLAAQ